MRKYGLPYQGSKSKIAAKIIKILPSANRLYDVFAGGCAIPHAAMLSGKYKEIVANDITDTPKLFRDAINGNYRDEKRWISREDFFALKDSDPYIRLCWSFGNNGRDYLYSKEVEPWKKALHYARVFGDCSLLREMGIAGDGSNSDIMKQHDEYRQKMMLRLNNIESLQRLQRLQRHIPSLFDDNLKISDITISNTDYRNVEISGDAVIYCDPPYKGTCGYGMEFDHEAFYDWSCAQSVPVFISEYAMPQDRFTCVAEFDHRSTLSATANIPVIERIFIPR